jgi:hypothetical protein
MYQYYHHCDRHNRNLSLQQMIIKILNTIISSYYTNREVKWIDMYLIDHERTHNSQAHTWLKSQLIESLQNAIAQNNFYLLVSIKCLAKKKSLVNITTVMLTPTQKATKLWPFLHLPPRIKSQYNCLFSVYFPG